MTLTDNAFENLARSIAEAINGGSWDIHYTDDQKNVWRLRASLLANRG